MRNLAKAVHNGQLSLDAPPGLDEAERLMTQLAGVGPWTAQYVAMRAFKEPDAFPASDLGLRKALSRGPKPVSPSRLAKRAEAWRPWRAYAAMHLWSNTED